MWIYIYIVLESMYRPMCFRAVLIYQSFRMSYHLLIHRYRVSANRLFNISMAFSMYRIRSAVSWLDRQTSTYGASTSAFNYNDLFYLFIWKTTEGPERSLILQFNINIETNKKSNHYCKIKMWQQRITARRFLNIDTVVAALY